MRRVALSVLALLASVVACGGADLGAMGDGPDPKTEKPPPVPTDTTGGGGGGDGGGGGATDGGVAAPLDGSAGAVHDPNANGPLAIQEKDASLHVNATGDDVGIHAAFPAAAGSYPVVVVAHGFQIPTSEYYGYVRRLATFGYVALTVDFPAEITYTKNQGEAQDLVAGIDWAKSDATIGPLADPSHAGIAGHEMGGKLAVLAATKDTRVKAIFLIDPVDGSGDSNMSCDQPDCVVTAPSLTSLQLPVGILGETTDTSGVTACAPSELGSNVFYGRARTPALQVTVAGANNRSFLDDVSACPFNCGVCNSPSAPNAQVAALGHAYTTAFFERWLRGNTGYDTYLTGSQAQARYVTTNQAAITSK